MRGVERAVHAVAKHFDIDEFGRANRSFGVDVPNDGIIAVTLQHVGSRRVEPLDWLIRAGIDVGRIHEALMVDVQIGEFRRNKELHLGFLCLCGQ
ncbi:hypothetical protein D3C75_1161220 [compost metagenome]